MGKTSGPKNRREFLAALSKLSGVMATLGITQVALTKTVLGQSANIEPIRRLFDEAVETGDMEAAIRRYGVAAKLAQNELNALRSLTPNELATMKSIQQKLKSLSGGKICCGTYACTSGIR